MVERERYNLLELVSDVGGISGGLMIIASISIQVLNYNYFDSYMASQLFTIRKPKGPDLKYRLNPKKPKDDEFTEFSPSRTNSICEFFQDLFSSCCSRFRHCKKNRRQRAIEKARNIFEQEANIVDIIRSRRFFYLALKHMLSDEKRHEFLQRSSFVKIDPSASGSDAVQDAGTLEKASEVKKKIM